MLRVEHLRIGALPPLSFGVADGECFAIEGPSGSGKTRLLRAIADLDPADGQIFLDGIERHEMPAPDWRKAVRYLAAEPGWWSDTPEGSMPVDPEFRPRLVRFANSLGLEEALLERPLSLLSTGERQRLALVRGLADEPKVLLLDEPTGPLDVGATALVEEMIRFQLLAGRSVMIASHDPALLDRIAHARLQLGPSAHSSPPSRMLPP